ncbi:GNAT family N-acetyltransferase [Candidatus Pacearchaeota archaeon]|nr:GNAT family N-acetyltransferase [Candidatus Pacearchaeota archaeon]
MKIISLNKKNVDEASSLLLDVFHSEKKDIDYPPKWLKASLNPEKNKKLYAKFDVKYLRYWVAVSEKKVVGIVGLYTHAYGEKESYWLGWYCVSPEFRGRGVGKALLEFAIDKSRKAGKKWLRLYTSNDPGEKRANQIYDKLGFAPIRDKKLNDIIKRGKFKDFSRKMVYREMAL